MADEGLTARVKEDNPDPRVACALLLDTSSSMDMAQEGEGSGAKPITLLNEGFSVFCDEIKADDLAKKRTEIMVVTFGGVAHVEIPFTEGRDLQPRTFSASGGTPLGAALNLALDELTAQKQAYKAAGLEYFRPWLFVLTDGQPTDGDVFDQAAERVRKSEAAKGIAPFAIGVGDAPDMAQLKKLSDTREPLRLQGLSFREFFQWLSASMSVVSNSGTFGGSDETIATAEANEQNALPSPKGWAHW